MLLRRLSWGFGESLGLGSWRRGGTGAMPPNKWRRCGLCFSRGGLTTTSSLRGEAHSVREFAELAFAVVGLDWRD